MASSGDIAELLRLYFIQQRSVNLPGIGGFELNRIPAEADHAAGVIRPPHYTIKYNSLSDIPSKEMFAFISRKKDISEWEAIGVVNNFSMAVSDQLKKGQRFVWNGIGSLEHDSSGQLEFQPEATNLDFALDIIIDPTVEKEYINPFEQEEAGTVEARVSWWVTAAVLAAIALVVIFFSVIRNEYKLTNARQTRFVPATAPIQNETKLAD